MTVKIVEDAYEALAAELLEFIENDEWTSARSVTSIIENMTQTLYQRSKGDVTHENDRFPTLNTAGPASRAAIFLRDEMLRTTGHRIWGVTFTLYPTGKFKLDYNYNKPEGYEESGQPIDLQEAVSRLEALGAEVRVEGDKSS